MNFALEFELNYESVTATANSNQRHSPMRCNSQSINPNGLIVIKNIFWDKIVIGHTTTTWTGAQLAVNLKNNVCK